MREGDVSDYEDEIWLEERGLRSLTKSDLKTARGGKKIMGTSLT